MSLAEAQRLVYRDKFRSLHSDTFQSWFEELLRALHPVGDFQAIRKTQGDGGLDGFVISSQLVYAIYAPARRAEDRDSETATKIHSDFATAFSTLQGKLKEWVFVHNHPEGKLGKLGVRAINQLKAHHPSIEITVLNIDGMWEKLNSLPAEAREHLFGLSQGSAPPAPSHAEERLPANLKKLLAKGRKLTGASLYPEARPIYQKALAIAGKQSLPHAYAEAMEYLIEILTEQKDLHELTTKLEQAIKWFSKIRSCSGAAQMAHAAGRIAFYYETLDDVHLALNYWNMAALEFDALADHREWVQCRAGAARCTGKLGGSASALSIWQDIRRRFAGSPDNYLVASIANHYGTVCSILCRFAEAKVCYDEAEALAIQFGHENILHMARRNRDQLEELLSSQRVPEVGYGDLIKELYQLFDWFPEAKDAFVPFWFECRRPDLQSSIRTMPGLKFLLVQDDSEAFSATASSLHAYGTLFLQILSTPFPDPAPCFDDYLEVPFPLDKPLYSCVDTESWRRDSDGEVLTIPNDGHIRSTYCLTPNKTTSKSTGNEGRIVAGFPVHLPAEAYDFFYSRSARDLLEQRLFFLPVSRESLTRDLGICQELDLIPIYYGEMPRSEHVEGFLNARVRLPTGSLDFPGPLAAQITALKHALIRLASTSPNHAKIEFAEVLARAEELTRACPRKSTLDVEIVMLRLPHSTEHELRLALVVHDQVEE